jgi:hypothetical protein
MKRLLLTLLGPVAAMLSANPAFAHRDYETPVATLQDARGNSFIVVRYYTDGIVMLDPVKLVVYDFAGVVVADTPYFRDVLIDPAQDGTLRVYGVDLLGLSFWRGWVVKEGGLVPLNWPSSLGLALWANLSAHWLGYGFSFMLPWVPTLTYRRRAKTSRVWKSELVCLALAWLSATIMYGRLAMLLTIGFYSLGILTLFFWLRRPTVVKAPLMAPASS